MKAEYCKHVFTSIDLENKILKEQSDIFENVCKKT